MVLLLRNSNGVEEVGNDGFIIMKFNKVVDTFIKVNLESQKRQRPYVVFY